MKTIEQFVEQFGEEYRKLIEDYLAWLDVHEKEWGLEEPIDRDRWVAALIEGQKPPVPPKPAPDLNDPDVRDNMEFMGSKQFCMPPDAIRKLFKGD